MPPPGCGGCNRPATTPAVRVPVPSANDGAARRPAGVPSSVRTGAQSGCTDPPDTRRNSPTGCKQRERAMATAAIVTWAATGVVAPPRPQHHSLQPQRGGQRILLPSGWASGRRHGRRCDARLPAAQTLLSHHARTRGCGRPARRGCAQVPPGPALAALHVFGRRPQRRLVLHCLYQCLCMLRLTTVLLLMPPATCPGPPRCTMCCRLLHVQAVSAFLKGKTPWWRVPKPPNMEEVRGCD